MFSTVLSAYVLCGFMFIVCAIAADSRPHEDGVCAVLGDPHTPTLYHAFRRFPNVHPGVHELRRMEFSHFK